MRERVKASSRRLKDDLVNKIYDKEIVCIVGGVHAGKKTFAKAMAAECFVD